ncbi:MAG: cytochrome c oxidase accessory protein CcoG [Polyangia bacterium]
MTQSRTRSSPGLDKLHVLDERGGRRYIYPADVQGRFTRWRPRVFALLLLIYLALPWITVNGHPAVFINILERRFYLFGKVFNAQDFFYLFFVVSGVGFVLIVLAALFGRIFCGWACPQTVLLEGIYRRIERLIEGPATARAALARAPWTLNKLARRVLKHALFLLVSFVLAHLFLAYFVSIPELLRMMRDNPLANWTAFLWGIGLTGILYFNFFWFREQFCLILCPYGRLQSAMQDRDTVVIGYDKRRGEPRGKVGATGAGDCIDCRRCVAVCPTDIDIRNGLQMECIGCAGCIDACDEIMLKVGRKPGLIRYDSERALDGEPRRFIRPRVIAYAGLGLLGLLALATAFARYQPFEANLVRGRGAPYVIDGDTVRNHVLVHVINKRAEPVTLRISAPANASQPPADASGLQVLIPQPEASLAPLESRAITVVLSAQKSGFRPGRHATLRITDERSGAVRELEVPFAGPLLFAAPGRSP